MNDLFISYAHIDNLSISDDEKGWITDFHRILENRLAQLMGEQPRVWRDQKLTGNDIFDQKILSQFDHTKLMVSILSPRYIKSEWCLKEITQFYQSTGETGGFVFDGKSRILKVVKTPYDAENLPKISSQSSGRFSAVFLGSIFTISMRMVKLSNTTRPSERKPSRITSAASMTWHTKYARF